MALFNSITKCQTMAEEKANLLSQDSETEGKCVNLYFHNLNYLLNIRRLFEHSNRKASVNKKTCKNID